EYSLLIPILGNGWKKSILALGPSLELKIFTKTVKNMSYVLLYYAISVFLGAHSALELIRICNK
ncbi:MAG: hypothetical protein ACK55Z_12075, partial [bacterium]